MLPRSLSLQSLALVTVVVGQAQAQQSKQPLLLASATLRASPTDAARAKTIVLTGRVETTTGVLPGAVVEVKNNRSLRAVTDADGFFSLVVPTTTAPVEVVASYAGYDDISASLMLGALPTVLRLVVPHNNTKLPR